MMRKILLLLPILLLFGISFSVANDDVLERAESAQVDTLEMQPVVEIMEAFCLLHSDQVEILPHREREYMVIYYTQIDSILTVVTHLDGEATLDTMTDDYIKANVTQVGSLEMKRLPFKKDNIFAVINTVKGDAADSRIEFYDQFLDKLDKKKIFVEPQLKDFFDIPRGSLTKMSEIEQMVGFTTIEYRLNPEDCSLRAYLTIDKHINQDDYNIIRLFIRDSLIYDWDGKKYKMRKNK